MRGTHGHVQWPKRPPVQLVNCSVTKRERTHLPSLVTLHWRAGEMPCPDSIRSRRQSPGRGPACARPCGCGPAVWRASGVHARTQICTVPIECFCSTGTATNAAMHCWEKVQSQSSQFIAMSKATCDNHAAHVQRLVHMRVVPHLVGHNARLTKALVVRFLLQDLHKVMSAHACGISVLRLAPPQKLL